MSLQGSEVFSVVVCGHGLCLFSMSRLYSGGDALTSKGDIVTHTCSVLAPGAPSSSVNDMPSTVMVDKGQA